MINLDIANMKLVDSDVSKLVAAHKLGKLVDRTVYENIGFSLAFKLVVTGLALAGYVTFSYAIASDLGSLLPRDHECSSAVATVSIISVTKEAVIRSRDQCPPMDTSIHGKGLQSHSNDEYDNTDEWCCSSYLIVHGRR